MLGQHNQCREAGIVRILIGFSFGLIGEIYIRKINFEFHIYFTTIDVAKNIFGSC